MNTHRGLCKWPFTWNSNIKSFATWQCLHCVHYIATWRCLHCVQGETMARTNCLYVSLQSLSLQHCLFFARYFVTSAVRRECWQNYMTFSFRGLWANPDWTMMKHKQTQCVSVGYKCKQQDHVYSCVAHPECLSWAHPVQMLMRRPRQLGYLKKCSDLLKNNLNLSQRKHWIS